MGKSRRTSVARAILARSAHRFIVHHMDAVFRALADPTRREIPCLLRERGGPYLSGEIAAHFASS